MKIKNLTETPTQMHFSLLHQESSMSETVYDDDISNIEDAFNIPIPPDTTEPCALFIVSDIGIFAVESMTLKDVILLIRKNNFKETSVEMIPQELVEKLTVRK